MRLREGKRLGEPNPGRRLPACGFTKSPRHNLLLHVADGEAAQLLDGGFGDHTEHAYRQTGG